MHGREADNEARSAGKARRQKVGAPDSISRSLPFASTRLVRRTMLLALLVGSSATGATAFVPALPLSSARRPFDAGARRRVSRGGRGVALNMAAGGDAAAAAVDGAVDDAARAEQVSNPTHGQHQQFASDIDQQCWTSADFWQVGGGLRSAYATYVRSSRAAQGSLS